MAYRGCCYDYDTGLYYVENRYYDSSIGRFVNASGTDDNGSLGTTSNYSLYTYWENHPLWYVDSDMKEIINANSIANYLHNKQVSNMLTDFFESNNGFIFNQNANEMHQYRFGFNQVGLNGCGLVATYNAFLLLENQTESQDIVPIEFHNIIREYEQGGLLAYGCFGLHPLAIAQFFIKRGYDVSISFNKFEKTTIDNDANIMFYLHNTGNHYVAIKYDEGIFKGYNTFCNNTTVDNLENINVLFDEDNTYTAYLLISISKD